MITKFLVVFALALFWYFMGVLLKKLKPNPFWGIAASWTVNDETVWKKANGFAGKLLKIIAPFFLIGFFLNDQSVLLGVICFISVVVVIVAYVYGYLLHKKNKKLKD
ncbi:hypothetical protein COU12_00055 [Candidatus Jorgensenbacteria bacterium CG10_big_fil_rev_8_21_14_0_10_54_38]|uniref:SdpI family protein n=2 Tax=Candidatus Joergenseniibacteriota TaxID=1752739 RepID=A0A2M6WGR4_9BACT|nr:MAG: hypothetical protein COX26_02265 [Candidatus Jorgensenbacteria bacterium CG23_combo_of_CG06-09_8_20_14_all_54_14]PIT91988.1 MAG: hypothetical protein COU12_00055 [Candidatus Jorgensenbacteria bacterium CG10_big_fil_rev_8_21_14_0_10_54_38]